MPGIPSSWQERDRQPSTGAGRRRRQRLLPFQILFSCWSPSRGRASQYPRAPRVARATASGIWRRDAEGAVPPSSLVGFPRTRRQVWRRRRRPRDAQASNRRLVREGKGSQGKGRRGSGGDSWQKGRRKGNRTERSLARSL